MRIEIKHDAEDKIQVFNVDEDGKPLNTTYTATAEELALLQGFITQNWLRLVKS